MIPEYPYQRCSGLKNVDIKTFNWDQGVISQKKADGMYDNVNVAANGEITILSRGGKICPQDEFQDLIVEIKRTFPKGTQSHGEMLVMRNGKELPRQIGNGLLNSIIQGEKFPDGDRPLYVVWDQIPLSSAVTKGKCEIPYSERFTSLSNQLESVKHDNMSIQLVDSKIVHNMEEAMIHYREMVSQGFEGTILKDRNAGWKDGTSKFQVKLKVEADCDLEIIGFNPGSGKNAATFGSINVRSSDGLLEVNLTGFTDDHRLEIWNKHESMIGTIIAVKANSIMPPSGTNSKYSLFLPRFLEFRTDKTEADNLQRVKDQFDEALKSM